MNPYEFLRSYTSASYYQESSMLSEEQQPAYALSRNFKIRGTAACLLCCVEDATPQDQQDILEFCGIVANADDVLDSIPGPYRFESPEHCRDYILNQSILLPDYETSVGDMVEAYSAHVSDDKQMLTNQFLDSMIQLHWQGNGKGHHGQYGLNEAKAYRKNTNGPYFVTGLQLLGMSEDEAVHKLAYIKQPGNVMQLFDDALFDWQQDYTENSLNLFIGMAQDCGEMEGLVDAYEQLPSNASFGDLRKVVRSNNLQYTRQMYNDLLTEELAEMTQPFYKSILNIVAHITR